MIDTSERDFEETIEEALTGASEDTTNWAVHDLTTTYGTPGAALHKTTP